MTEEYNNLMTIACVKINQNEKLEINSEMNN